ncbi:hypothetical protein QZH41_005938 [Actinostola sp. cb2023]|nr:hypothetical protein QZH41_005938 [Actinostola sp. cb2023]
MFDEKNNDLYHMFKDNNTGGPSIIFHRYHEAGKTKIREVEMSGKGEEAKECKKILGFDANALYLWAIMQEMPTSSYTRTRAETNFKPESSRKMADEWIAWEEYERNIRIRNQLNNTEKRIGERRLPVDGFHSESRTVFQFHDILHNIPPPDSRFHGDKLEYLTDLEKLLNINIVVYSLEPHHSSQDDDDENTEHPINRDIVAHIVRRSYRHYPETMMNSLINIIRNTVLDEDAKRHIEIPGLYPGNSKFTISEEEVWVEIGEMVKAASEKGEIDTSESDDTTDYRLIVLRRVKQYEIGLNFYNKTK